MEQIPAALPLRLMPKALEGFCKKNGVDPSSVTLEADAKGVEYVYAVTKDDGKAAGEVLTAELPALAASITFKKSMRWGAGDTAFSRPVRSLLALHGSAVLPFSFAGLTATSYTHVLRNSATPEVAVPSAAVYCSVLQANQIQLGLQERKSAIWEAVQKEARSLGGEVPDSCKGDLLDEVSNLVESPTIVAGSFDPSFLVLPRDVLVMVMRKHQRYFPLFAADSEEQLLPNFVTVANGPVDPPTVAAGNEAVLRARFEDAAFFYKEDLKQPLEDFRPKLKGTMFQKDLGSLFDKTERVEKLVATLASATGMESATATAVAAAHLSKADLATSTVMEMTALAGIMGRHYALMQGVDPVVAEAVFESVLPRQAGDILPSSPAGILVAVAERLDSLVGLFAAGCAPTASADQFALRRAAVGLIQILLANKVSLSLKTAVSLAAKEQPLAVSAEVESSVVEFIKTRLEQVIVDQGVPLEAVRAVLAERGDNPSLAVLTAEELKVEWEAGEDSSLRRAIAALGRPTRIVRGKEVDPAWTVDEALFDCDEEKNLYTAYKQLQTTLSPSMSMAEFLAACEPLAAPIDAFFEKVFVMCEDEAVRKNRLAFLRDLAAVPSGIVDLSQLPGF
eukprot:gene32510-17216_t